MNDNKEEESYMYICVLKSKIHNATITDTKIDYEGSITIDTELIEKADMYPYEKVLVADITNGARFETYIIPGKAGSREFCINGAAARLVEQGDKIIVMAFGWLLKDEIKDFTPVILRLDDKNNII